ncbi:DUF1641 domain-containing protein [Bacillus songklensis]|uniref:DUF1641 domain-containing protein n=1 Tax=Bacillus songklensis TaxID=1069116 RepID=A0ABV8B7H5_9BACI
MAKAIRQINKKAPNKEEEQAQAITDIVKALADNREAIMVTLDILKNLHEMGALNAVDGLLKARSDVAYIAIQQLNQPSMHNTIKNAMGAFKFLGSVNPDQLQTIFQGLSHGLERSAENIKKGEDASLWQLGKSIRNPDVRASLSTMVEFLQGMGEVFHHEQREVH